jgi:hypothetical protein
MNDSNPDIQYNYFTLGLSNDPTAAVISDFDGVYDPWELNEGVRMKDKFPADVVATLKPDRGRRLTDFLHNVEKVVPISERVQIFFMDEGLDDRYVEYLPFILKNQRGRIVKDIHYCIANPLIKIDCIDRSKSKYSTYDDETDILSVSYMYLDKEKIPLKHKFFRLGEQPKYIIFRSDFIDRIKTAGFTGLNLTAMGEKIW